MIIAELNPDEVLARLLDNRVEVPTSETERHTIRCYADNKTPNIDLADEFLSIMVNGPVHSRTNRPGLFKGNIALIISVRLLSDGTAKTQTIRRIIAQCERKAQGRCTGGFVFRIDPKQVITPTTPNLITGYSATVINIEWRTI